MILQNNLQFGRFIPDNESWLYKNGNSKALDKAIKWAKTHKRSENFDEIEHAIENEYETKYDQ